MQKRIIKDRCIILMVLLILAFIMGLLIKDKSIYDATIKNYEKDKCQFIVCLEKSDEENADVKIETEIKEDKQKLFFDSLKNIRVARLYARPSVEEWFENQLCSVIVNISAEGLDYSGISWAINFYRNGRTDALGFYGIDPHFSFWESGLRLADMNVDVKKIEELMSDYTNEN